jgi:DNA primase
MNVLDLAFGHVKLKKVSGTNGGEWQGPCPACGGDDRFHVWPEQNEGKGAYWCRVCGKTGDNIQYLRDFCGMSFRDACAELRIDLPDHRDSGAPPPQRTKPVFQPVSHASPADLWQERAEKFVAWSQSGLANNAEALAWLAGRGISRETAINYRLGWNAGEDGKDLYRARKAWGLPDQFKDDGRPKALWIPRGLVIPYIIDGIIHRIRIRRPEGEPRYYVLPGSSMSTMLLERTRRVFVVVESELDAIAVAAGNTLAGAVALGSVSAKPDAETFAVLQGALQILNALDYDAAGAKAYDWWAEHFDRCDRWPVPKGKDPGEAIRLGIDLDKWIKEGMPPALTIADPEPIRYREPVIRHTEMPTEHLSPPLCELYLLLRNNPRVKIINQPTRFTVLRDGKYVGGRINELVFRYQEVTDYLMNHPAEEIDSGNLIMEGI